MDLDTNANLSLGDLTCRLRRLEEQNERLSTHLKRARFALSLFFLAGMGFFGRTLVKTADGASPTTPKILRANGFMVVDKAGVERAMFSYNDIDQVAVLNLEPEKTGRINLGIGRDGVGIRLSHEKNDINMGWSEKAGTYLVMYDKDGKQIFEQRGP